MLTLLHHAQHCRDEQALLTLLRHAQFYREMSKQYANCNIKTKSTEICLNNTYSTNTNSTDN